MHVRRRAQGAGAVLAAAAGLVLSPTPAQAGCGAADQWADQWADRQATHWQVGMQLGSAPVSLTGTGGAPAVLLGALPASTIAVKDLRGQNLLRLNASARLPEAPRPTFAENVGHEMAEQLPAGLDVAAPVDRSPARAAAAQAPAVPVKPVGGATGTVDRAAGGTAAVPTEVPLQVPGADSVLGGRYAWVPIEGVAGFGPDADGLPWMGGLVLAVLAGGVGAVTVVARHRRTSAG